MLAATTLLAATAVFAARPDAGMYPNLVKSWEAIQAAKGHVQKAEANHAGQGGLGGHGAEAVKHINAAPLTARPDDVRYPNLGDARLQVEWAIRHVEDAMQYHAPIGTLGGHGERAVEHLRNALREISEAEHWADAHHK
jgi:hypothetical protein